ncbi:winged helix-turn-helix domain-containing protein [Qipengyuania vesicularis]|uniref:winged helix-turn-helix domain-containing protein n=1 Tax=Qipengyuania vesicularis TaxID=2867232 RepID=UPI001C88AD02|nr:winged helix-turn-helix domain-containing protein [Qipengyuania vesicularis]
MEIAEYTWLSVAPSPPGRWDLRLLGWRLRPEFRPQAVRPGLPTLLDWRIGFRCSDWTELPHKQAVIAVGVDEPEVRAQLIGEGFGDALSSQIALVELAARLLKLEGLDRKIPRQQRIGPVNLDLFFRDAQVDGKWIGLHPREFALLWRLAETPNRPVSRAELLRDVWRLNHEPETNSLEVHVSRLRAKLAVSHVGWIVETHENGGYCIGSRPHGEYLRVDRVEPMTQEYRPEQPRISQTHEFPRPRHD